MCPFCHEDVASAGESQRVCRECLSRHHAACWGELGRCASCQANEALEEAPPFETEVKVCRGCGTHGPREAYTCPCCTKGVCQGCYNPRFRRCTDCAVELIQAELRLTKAKQSHENRQGAVVGLFFCLILPIVGIIAALSAKSALGTLASGLGLVAIACLISLAWRGMAEKKREVDELEIELAPYPPLTFPDKLVAGAKRVLRSLRGG